MREAGLRTAAAVACAGGGWARGRCWGTAKMKVSGSGWAESPCCGCILGAGCGRLLGEVDWAKLFLLIGVKLWPARGHLAGAGGLRRRNGGEISGPRSPQPPVPPLSSEEIELPGGSASAGGAAVITTTTGTRNAYAIITDTIRLRYKIATSGALARTKVKLYYARTPCGRY